MNHKGVRIAALALAGIITIGNYPVSSATGVASVLPAAGFALAIGEGIEISNTLAGRMTDSSKERKKIEVSTQLERSTEEKTSKSPLENLVPDKTAQEETEQNTDAPVINTTLDTTTSDDDADAEATASGNDAEDAETTVSGETDSKDKADKTEDLETADTVSANDTAKNETQSKAANVIEQDFSDLVIAQVTNYVNVRAEANEESEIVGKLYNKSVGTFMEEENGWYKIQSGNVEGFVKGEFCVTGKKAEALVDEVGEKIATVTTTTLKVRKEPGLDAEVLGLIPIEEELPVLEEKDGWVKISIEEGEGYVSSDYVSLRVDFVRAESKAEEEARLAKEEKARQEARAAASARIEENASKKSKDKQEAPIVYASSEGSAAGQAVASYGLRFVGNPYVYGGTSLTNGADCSGFVMSVYSNFGVSLPHSSSADRHAGYAVEGGLANAQPGDLVCYSGHVAIYIGNGQIVHASTSRTGIIVSNAAYRNVLAVRRIF